MLNNKFFTLFIGIFFTLVLPEEATSQTFSQTQKITASDRKPGDWFYWSSISGNYMVVGAPANSFNLIGGDSLYQAGAVYVYKKNSNGNWIEIQKLIAPDRKTVDWFGYSVSISGDYIVVGAHKQDSDENGLNIMGDGGAAYVYEKDNTGTWVFKQKLVASDRHVSAWFGTRVSVSGNYIASTSNNQSTDVNGQNWLNAAGAVHIFKRDNNGNWLQDQKIVAPDRHADDYFGNSVFLNGNLLAVGSVGNDLDENGNNYVYQSGAVYVYEKNLSNNWNFVQKVVAPVRDSMDWFGYSQIAIQNQNLVVGAQYQDTDANGTNPMYDAGAAYIFTRALNGTYSLLQKITPTTRIATDNFGTGVAIDNDYIVVGASLNDYDTLNQNLVVNGGAAYVFKYSNTNGKWKQFQKIIATNRHNMSNFGICVAIDSTDIIVGSPYEKYDFNEQNYYSWGSGAVYSYRLTSPSAVSEINKNEFSVFPNPFMDNVTIKINSSENLNYINIINAHGENVFTKKNFLNNDNISISTTEWASGIYFLEFVYSNKTFSHKIIHIK